MSYYDATEAQVPIDMAALAADVAAETAVTRGLVPGLSENGWRTATSYAGRRLTVPRIGSAEHPAGSVQEHVPDPRPEDTSRAAVTQ